MADLILLFFLLVCAVTAVAQRVIKLGNYSFDLQIMAVVWVRLGAVDVAITEASVGQVSLRYYFAVLTRVKRRRRLPGSECKSCL